MTDANLTQGWHDLLFGVRRSVRYHTRRRRFFDRFHTLASALAVLFGSATVYALFRQWDPRVAAACAVGVTATSTFDLVVGSATVARLHADLVRRFLELEKSLVMHTQSPERLRELTAERLTIEADEPPVLHNLNIICHNELVRAAAHGDQHLVPLGYPARLLAHVFDLGSHTIRPTR